MNNKVIIVLSVCLLLSAGNLFAGQVEYAKNNIIKTDQIIHENNMEKSQYENTKVLNTTKNDLIAIHENSIKMDNFLVHENVTRSKYVQGIDKIRIPDQKKMWTAAASQATLLFNPTAEERDQAINKLIVNGGWFKVAKKLLSSENSKNRISGVQILKSTLEHPKYNNVSQDIKIRKITPILLKTLNDNNSKVRFISALIVNNLLEEEFNYKFNSNEQERINSIALMTDYLKKNYNLY